MLRFFRQIRQRLLTENRFSRYLLYALGEILLVVFGILIAIQVDNWNEDRVRRTKIDQILKELLEEIENNIYSVENKINRYQIMDSLSYLVLNRQLTLEDYMKRDNHPKLYSIPNFFEIAPVRQNAFDKLTAYFDNFPREYQGILNHLKEVQERAGMLELYNSKMIVFTDRYINYLSNNYEWFGSNHTWNENMDYLDYLVNDFYYMNTIKSYRLLALGNHAFFMVAYKFYAVNCYYEIAKQLEFTDRLDRFKVDAPISDAFLGRWKSVDEDTELEYTLLNGLLHKTTTTKTGTEKERFLHIVSSKGLEDGHLIQTGSWYNDPSIQYTKETIHLDTLKILTNSGEAIYYRID